MKNLLLALLLVSPIVLADEEIKPAAYCGYEVYKQAAIVKGQQAVGTSLEDILGGVVEGQDLIKSFLTAVYKDTLSPDLYKAIVKDCENYYNTHPQS